ncbi:MAG: Hpt domain-containing protein [Oleibacter sp.]|nr:Hpt domain-containing protein [Thalassolituus sp.]
MEFDAALSTYIVEGRELLQEMEESLLRLDNTTDTEELLNAIFRAAHTIKGSAGLFGHDDIVAFTHGVESLLDKVRTGELIVTEDMVALLLLCGDYISTLIDQVEKGNDVLDKAIRNKGVELGEKLQLADSTTSSKPTQDKTSLPEKQEVDVERLENCNSTISENWHISLRFGPDSLRDGMDPLSFLRYLATVGTVINITPIDEAIPAITEMDAESCYLGFEIHFKARLTKKRLKACLISFVTIVLFEFFLLVVV